MVRFSLVVGSILLSSAAVAAPCTYTGSVPAYVGCIASQASDALDQALLNDDRIQDSLEMRYSVDGGPETTVPVSAPYHLTITSINAGSTVAIPSDVIDDLCGDPDGCAFRIGMTRWSAEERTGAANDGGRLYLDPTNGHWRSDVGDVNGTDGDGITQHVLNAGSTAGTWDTCYLTDGAYAGYVGMGDPASGFGLLMWDGYDHPTRTCELTILD